MAPETMPNSTVPQGSSAKWTDKKRYLWLIGLVVPSLALIAFVGNQLTGWSVWLWIGPIIILGVVPAIDLVAGLDRSNPPDDVLERLENDKYYRWITYLFLPIQYLGFLGAFVWMAKPEWLGVAELSSLDKLGLAISIGAIGGIGINTAHELGHKKESHERWLSKIALAQSFYGHFYIEHNRGHHVRVATPEDPASSRFGENFYQFWPRTVVGSVKNAWRLEKKRYARKNKHPFRIGNDVLNAWLMSAVLWGALMAVLGIGILPYLVIQAIVGFSLLEVVNFMEHYGMLRQKVGVGERQRYERIDPSHSWNSNNIATNVLLYHLQRHSDHHANPTRRYQTLRDFEESPVLPTGYAGMIVLAIVPAVWRRVMDPRVVAHFGGDLSLANISPRKRDKILAKYALPLVEEPCVEEGAPAPVSKRAPASALRDGRGATSSGTISKPVDQVVSRRPRSSASSTTEDEVLAARCPSCGYTYDVARGDEHEGFAAGTAWADIPDSWCCPDCGVREKVDFVAVDPEFQSGLAS